MKFNELKEKDVGDLNKELYSLLREKFNMCMQKSLGETPRTHRFKEIRRDIARIKTILNEKKGTESS